MHAREVCQGHKVTRDFLECVTLKSFRRYSEKHLGTHDKLFEKAVSCCDLKTVVESSEHFDVIGIDEGQVGVFGDTSISL